MVSSFFIFVFVWSLFPIIDMTSANFSQVMNSTVLNLYIPISKKPISWWHVVYQVSLQYALNGKIVFIKHINRSISIF